MSASDNYLEIQALKDRVRKLESDVKWLIDEAVRQGSPIEALRAVVRRAGDLLGCGDNSCLFIKPRGMATNGGCRCLNAPGVSRTLSNLYKAALQVVEPDNESPRAEPPKGEP